MSNNRKPGRPRSDDKKIQVAIKLSRDVVEELGMIAKSGQTKAGVIDLALELAVLLIHQGRRLALSNEEITDILALPPDLAEGVNIRMAALVVAGSKSV